MKRIRSPLFPKRGAPRSSGGTTPLSMPVHGLSGLADTCFFLIFLYFIY